MLIERDAEAEQQLAGARFRGVAVELGELHLQLGDSHAVFFAHFRQRVDAVALGLHLPQLGVAHDHRVDHAEIFIGELILAQLAQTHVGLEHHLAGRWLQLATEDLHEGRLAAAVGADETVAVAAAEFDGDVFEQRLGTELHGDVGGGDQGLTYQCMWRRASPIRQQYSALQLAAKGLVILQC